MVWVVLLKLSGNLGAEDGQKYDKLFKRINPNQEILQKQNLETIRINK